MKCKNTPEELKKIEEAWEYFSTLFISDISGKVVNPEEYEQEKLERQQRQEAQKRTGDRANGKL